MRIIIFLCGCFFSLPAFGQSYKKIHRKAIVIDTHNDIIMKSTDTAVADGKTSDYSFDKNLRGKTHSDLIRWKEGGLDCQIFSIFCDETQKDPFSFANLQLDTLDAVISRNPDKITKVFNAAQLLSTVKKGRIAAMAGVEGGHMIENDLKKLDSLYNKGVRYMTLTWNNSTEWATSAMDEVVTKGFTRRGMTPFGKQVVAEMNRLGMMIDVSRNGEATFWDVIRTTTKPIIASHSSVYNLCHHQRNLKDEQIKAIAKNGGVIQVNFYPGFIDSSFGKKQAAFIERHKDEFDSLKKAGMADWNIENRMFEKYDAEAKAMRPALSILIDHIDYIKKLVGVDYVGLGSDFDGITITPQQLDDVTPYPLITKALLDRGYTKKEVYKVLGGNLIRVLKANEN